MVEQPFSDDPTLELDSKQRIAELRARFQKSWESKQRIRIEDLLDEVPASERRELFLVLLQLELTMRRGDGDNPDGTKYETRFSEYRDVVRDVFKEDQDQDFSTSRRSITETMSKEQKPQPTTDVLSRGKKIGRFAVQRILGVGGFGTVYLAHDVELDRQVAIKCPRAERFDSVEKMEQFVGEARTVAKLKHAGIVAIYDVARQEDGSPFVVMEFVDGRSLKELVDTERLPLQKTAELMSQIADAVSFAHQNGYVHRDLKPANILLDGAGIPHVADFGLAVHEDDQRQRRGEVSGTLSYMSPEQVRGDVHHIDGRSDIWSLGVILYEMVTGRLPFGGESFDEISDEILNREPRPPRQMDDSIPDDLEAIINRCCAKEVKDRYSTAADIARDLRQLAITRAVNTANNASLSGEIPARRQLRTAFKIGNLGCAISLSFALVLITCGFVVLPKLFDQTDRPTQLADNSVPKENVIKDDESPELKPKQLGTQAEGDRDPQFRMMSPAFRGAAVRDGSIDVVVWDPNDGSRRGRSLHRSEARPLKTGDGVRVEARLKKPAYIYILWIDSEGTVLPLYPWQIGDWDSRDSDESPVDRVSLPSAADEALPLEGNPGMETLVMLVRETPLEADVDLKQVLGDIPPQPAQQPGSFVEFVNGKVVTEQQNVDGEPKLYDPHKIGDPVLTTQRLIYDKLSDKFSDIYSLSFANPAVVELPDDEQLRTLLKDLLIEVTPRKQIYANAIEAFLADPNKQNWSSLQQDAQANQQQVAQTIELLHKVDSGFVDNEVETFRQLAFDLQNKRALYQRLLQMKQPSSDQDLRTLSEMSETYGSLLGNLKKHEDAILRYVRGEN